MEPITLGVSACLLGRKVRYDGKDKFDPCLHELLSPYFLWFALCPEWEAGLGVPREALDIYEKEGREQVLTRHSHREVTSLLSQGIQRILSSLPSASLSGFILKSRSPSCDTAGKVPRYDSQGQCRGSGPGLFVPALLEHLPFIPFIDEEGIHKKDRLFAFLSEIATYREFSNLWMRGITSQALRTFHASHRVLIMAQAPELLPLLDSIVAHSEDNLAPEEVTRYYGVLREALQHPATASSHAHALTHVYQMLKPRLSATGDKEIRAMISALRNGTLSFTTVRATLVSYNKKDEVPTLIHDAYLFPPPWLLTLQEEMMSS